MQSFIHRKNLEHYRKLLAETTDDATRQTIQELLAAEESKDRKLPNDGMAASAVVNPAEPDKKEQGGGG